MEGKKNPDIKVDRKSGIEFVEGKKEIKKEWDETVIYNMSNGKRKEKIIHKTEYNSGKIKSNLKSIKSLNKSKIGIKAV